VLSPTKTQTDDGSQNVSVKLYEMVLNNNLINDVTTTLVVGKATPHG